MTKRELDLATVTVSQQENLPRWEEGDTVKVGDRQGIVKYIYTNGFTLIRFPDTPIKGGIFSNDSSFRNAEITLVAK